MTIALIFSILKFILTQMYRQKPFGVIDYNHWMRQIELEEKRLDKEYNDNLHFKEESK